jgi:MoaA/NifB/PqqE/SkfB family radical SAM enzyme
MTTNFDNIIAKTYKNDLKNHSVLLNKQKNAILSGLYPSSFSAPILLQFELTSKCNLFCNHCYNRSGELPQDLMTTDKWLQFSKEIVENGGIFECVLSGGEPLLLGDKLFDIMDILHDDGTVFILITNGYLLNSEIINKLKKYRFRWIQVSIDSSNPAAHDNLRQTPGSWERAVKGATLITNAGLPLSIAASVTPSEINNISNLARLSYQCGASSLIVGEILPSGRSYLHTDLLMSNNDRGKLITLIKDLNVDYTNKMQILRSSFSKVQMLNAVNQPNIGCIIRPNGDIRLDCMAPFTIGNVLKSPFHDQWNLGLQAWQTEQVSNYINSLDDYSSLNSLYKNHLDEDIKL